MMNRMDRKIIEKINSARYFLSNGEYKAPPVRPWQYVLMEYERVGLEPPARIPNFESVEDAQIWMCLDARYNYRIREEQTTRYQSA